MKLTRKDFFKGLAIGTITLPVFIRSWIGENRAQNKPQVYSGNGQTYAWKMVTTWPPNFPILGEACNLFAELVNQMSNGRMEIKVYGGGELVPPLEIFDYVRTGGAEIGHGAGYYWAGKLPAAQFFATVPFGMNAQQVNAWIDHGGGRELWEALYADYNLIPATGGNTGVQMGGWFNREINSISDFQGLKMRIPGLAGQVLEKAGGSPVLLAGGEIYTGLERGVIDATEWLGPFHDYLMGFHEIAKYYYNPGWHEPGTALEVLFNREKFNALPNDLQAILNVASGYINGWVLSEMEYRNAQRLQTLVDEGIDIRSFSPEIIQQLRTYTNEVIAEITDKDPFTNKVYDSYRNFQDKANQYAGITEKPYYNNLQRLM